MPTTTTTHERHRSARQREAPEDCRHDREAVDDQRRPVVEQPFAVEDRHDPARHAEALENRGGGDRVGRRDDRAQDERAGPAETGAIHSTVTATATVLTMTSPTASRAIGRTFCRSRVQSVTQPPWKSSGGSTV